MGQNEKSIKFINEEAVGYINEEPIKAGWHHHIGKKIHFVFTVSVIQSINKPEFSSDSNFLILIISSISSFEMNKVNTFPALTAPFLFISISNVSKIDEIALVTNLGNL